MGKYFGTDGIRGVANKELTPEKAYAAARALGYYLNIDFKEKKDKKIVIGKDTRKSADLLEGALISGFSSMGFDIIKLGVIPTPAIAYLTRHYKASGGVVISASHNPGKYNGIKFFDKCGYKFSDDYELKIEDLMDNLDSINEIRSIGEDVGISVDKSIEARKDYVGFLISTVSSLDLTGKIIAIDCGNGASETVVEEVFKRLGAKTIAVNNQGNGININDGCGSTNPSVISDITTKNNAFAGFSFDGDADRVIVSDEKGVIMDGDHIMAVCATFLKSKGILKGDFIVSTVMANIGLKKYLETIGVNVVMTKVGDRYVLEEMVKKGYVFGGEQSGHIIFSEFNTTGDGILTALKICEAANEMKKSVSKLNSLMKSYPQVLVNAKVKNENKKKYFENDEIKEAIKVLETKFKDDGRVLIRPSGTEPLVRVMIEGKDIEVIRKEAEKLAQLIERRLN